MTHHGLNESFHQKCTSHFADRWGSCTSYWLAASCVLESTGWKVKMILWSATQVQPVQTCILFCLSQHSKGAKHDAFKSDYQLRLDSMGGFTMMEFAISFVLIMIPGVLTGISPVQSSHEMIHDKGKSNEKLWVWMLWDDLLCTSIKNSYSIPVYYSQFHVKF